MDVTQKIDASYVQQKLRTLDFGNMDEFLASLDELTLLETITYRSQIVDEIERWKSCRKMLDAIEALKSDDALNKQLQATNALSDHEFVDLDKFNQDYASNLEKLIRIQNKLTERINANKQTMYSTMVMTKEMIELMQKKIARIPESDPNHDLEVSKLQVAIDAMQRRTNLKYLSDKIRHNIERNGKLLRKVLKEDLPLIRAGRKTKTIKELCHEFSEEMVYKLAAQLTVAFKESILVYLMLWHLNRLKTRDSKGEGIWIKIFILNLTDIYNGIYDILSPNAEQYLQTITIFIDWLKYELADANMFDLLLPECKERINASDFGLKLSKNKKESEESPDGSQDS